MTLARVLQAVFLFYATSAVTTGRTNKMADLQTQPTVPTQPAGGTQAAPVAAPPTPDALNTVVKFTQADLDRIIAERLGRVESKYADYADLKKKVEDAAAANKSELEKAIEKANKAEARQKEIETQTRERVITAEAKAIAAELGFTKPDKAIKLADLSKAKYEEDGTVSGVREALEVLSKEMPELLNKKGAPNTGASNPAKTGDITAETDAQKRARLSGSGGILDWISKPEMVYYPKPGDQ